VRFAANQSPTPLLGFAGDPIGDGVRSAAPGNFKDRFELVTLTAGRIADKTFHFGSTSADSNLIAAVRSQDSGNRWRAAYFGFRLESMGALQRRTVVERTINWLSEGRPVAVAEREGESVPRSLRLEQNYPNPMNPSTNISFELPEAGFVTLKIFDTLGKEVATLVSEHRPAGRHVVQFDASRLTGGVYFYRVAAGGVSETRKLVLLK
jgi:hypothetical protein